MLSPMVTRSQRTSFGCQGLSKVPSSQLASNDDWFQRGLLKNAKHASMLGSNTQFLYQFSFPLLAAPEM